MKKLMITMALVVLILSNVCGHSLMNALADETELPEFQKLLSLMARTAANVNQIAQRCNATGNLYEEDVTELKSDYSELCEQMKQAVGEIARLRGIA